MRKSLWKPVVLFMIVLSVALLLRRYVATGSVVASQLPPNRPLTYPTPDFIYPPDSGYFNVRQSPYNCYGDGVHDDTACIKAAIDRALRVRPTAGRHGTIYFPEGTYLLSQPLTWATYGDNNARITAQIDKDRGCITSFHIENRGSGYGVSEGSTEGEKNAGPALQIVGGAGSGAEFYTLLGANGSIIGTHPGLGNLGSATCAGQGYAAEPKVTALNWKAYLRFEGQNKSKTVLKLIDHAPLFENRSCNVSPHGDPPGREYCAALIMTGNDFVSNSIGLGQTGYENDIWNLTINTGSGNPGAIGIDWVGANRASIKNVDIISGDGQGRCGLNVSRSSSAGTGPALAKNVSIRGFDYGIYARAAAEGIGNTFEYIDLSDIHVAGIVNAEMPNWFRKVSARLCVPAFINEKRGSLVVSDSVFTGTNENASAIVAPAVSSGGLLYLRNIETNGFKSALDVGSAAEPVPGPHITEYAFPNAVRSSHTNAKRFEIADVPNTPEYTDSDFDNWASVASFGAACAPNSDRDATACIQRALNSGKPVIYFPFGTYYATSTLHIPGSVRVVLGMNSFISSAVAPGRKPNGDGSQRAEYCTIQFDGNGPNSVEFRNFSFFQATQINTFCYNGSAPIVLADILGAVNVSNTERGTGTIFLENVAIPNASYHLRADQHVYARQYDIESGTRVHVAASGGIWWMFGFKSEGSGLLWDVRNAKFDLLGAFALAQGGLSPDPAFRMENSQFSLAGVSATPGGWKIAVEEVGHVRHQDPVNGLWRGGIGYGLYTGAP